MKASLQIEEGLSNWLLGTVVLSCAAPAITLNVWPRIDAMLNQGVSSNQLGIVLLVTLSALGMTTVPFAMKKAENIGFWLTCLTFGIFLATLNYTMAVGAVGKSRDDEAGSKQLVIQKANSLRLAIAEGEKSRRDLPLFKWTTQEMVATATSAVNLAREARDQECGKVGDVCRARVAQLANRQSELADLAASRAATEYAERIDRSVQSSRLSLTELGSIPESADQQASRLAAFLGTFLFLGAKPAETVASGLIHFLALCAEAFALGMPRIIVTALAKAPRKEEPKNVPAPQPTQPISKIPIPVPRPKPIRSSNVNLGSPADAEALGEWKKSRLIPSSGRVRTWDVYSDYQAWAKADGRKVLPFPSFNEELKKLGVKEENDPTLKRDFYLEVAIKTTLKAVS